MVKRLIISRNAYLSIDRIIEFNNLRNQSTTYATKFVKALFKQLYKLQKFPLIGIHTSRENTFVLIWNDYYIYYVVTDTLIEIQSVRHQKENVFH